MKKFSILMTFLILSGCATYSEYINQKMAQEKTDEEARPAREKAELEAKAKAEKDIQEAKLNAFRFYVESKLIPKCEAMGFAKGTDLMKTCIMNQYSLEQQQASQQSAQQQNADANSRVFWANALRNYGNTVYGPEATKAQQIQIQQPTTTHCSPDGFGGMRCTSY
jgi:hypothetical protein